jgi:hypothetical protein
MKVLFRNPTHTDSRSHDCLIAEIGNKSNGGKTVKFTYEANNAVERFNVEIFDGHKWNHFLSILDMGINPENSAYNIWDEIKRKRRADDLINLAESMCEAII